MPTGTGVQQRYTDVRAISTSVVVIESDMPKEARGGIPTDEGTLEPRSVFLNKACVGERSFRYDRVTSVDLKAFDLINSIEESTEIIILALSSISAEDLIPCSPMN